MDRHLLDYLPPVLREVLEYQTINEACEPEMSLAWDALAQVLANQFLETADQNGVRVWEKELRINPKDTDTLDTRKARIKAMWNMELPYTFPWLKNWLTGICGSAGHKETLTDYTLYIESAADSSIYTAEVAVFIERIKPANIVYVNRPYTAAELEISEEVGLSELVYKYRLGAWGLGQHPFAVGEDKGVIKTATTKSLTAELLADAAASLAANITAARINGSTVIDTLSKTADGATVTVTYTVPAGDISAVERYELLDADGNVLSAAAVYVPVTGSTVLKHTITVKESA